MAILTALVVVPFVQMLHDTAVWQEADRRIVRSAEPGDWTFFHYLRVFASPLSVNIFYRPLLHSPGHLADHLTCGDASGDADGLARRPDRHALPENDQDLRGHPYVLPSYTLALAWLDFFKNERIGGAAGICAYLFGVSPPDWLATVLFPSSSRFRSTTTPSPISSSPGRSSRWIPIWRRRGEVSRGGAVPILRRITFPLVLPALISAFILTFSRAVGTFGTPTS